MAAVKGFGNKTTEGRLIEYFRANKIVGWRRQSALFGRPDFVFPDKKVAIFADGCFWHGHNCRNVTPKANKAFWAQKIRQNKARAKKVNVRLRADGWSVYRIWECAILKNRLPSGLLKRLA